MCIPGCLEIVRENLTRRGFLNGVAAAGATVACATFAEGQSQVDDKVEPSGKKIFPAFHSVVDLTHPYSETFPHFAGRDSFVRKEMMAATAQGDGWNVYRWTLDEHAGTHIDSPFHRNPDGKTVDQIPAADLVLPLAVIDISSRADREADTELTLDDLHAWEKKHGALPARCCVAMNSGWEQHLKTGKFINMDQEGVRHFPGFHIDAVRFLVEQRDVVALASDTPSFDHGPTTDYPVHTLWLGKQRYALENVAALDKVPPRGATIVAGAPKIVGATGGHTRVLALV